MKMKTTILNIKQDGPQIFKGPNEEPIIGEIKKIFIKTNQPMYHTSLTFKTNEDELLFQVKLEQPITVIYPYNFQDKQGQGFLYYSHGDIFMEVEGLIGDDEIEQVSIFYS